MSVNVGNKPCIKSALSIDPMTSKKSVTFRYPDIVHPISYRYPKDYFYTQSETNKFRQERLGSAVSPVQRTFNIASSSYLMALILLIGMVAALPLLLLFKVFSALFSSNPDGDVDSSILPRSANIANKGRLSTRRRGSYMEHRDSINLHKRRHLSYLSSLDDE